MIENVPKKQLPGVNEYLFDVARQYNLSIRHAEFKKKQKKVLQPLEI